MELNFVKGCVEIAEDGLYSFFDEIISVGRINVELCGEQCKFIYYEDSDDYVFMYADSTSYNGLLKKIAGNRRQVREQLILYKNDFGVEHSIWKQLLARACKKFTVNEYDYCDDYNEDGGIDTSSDYISFSFHNSLLYPRKEEDLEEVYEKLVSILPQNIEYTKNKYIIDTIKSELGKYNKVCGNRYENKESYFKELEQDYDTDISLWNEERERLLLVNAMINDGIKADIISQHDYVRDVAFINDCIQFVSDQVNKYTHEILLKTYGPITEIKQGLRESINKLGFMDLLELYKEFNEKEKVLESKVRVTGSKADESPYGEYIDVYRFGSVLISDRMNHLNKNKAKNKYIPQEILDKALIFYYDTESVQDAYNERAIEKYSQDKESGNVGEQEVEYALKWLDKSYIRIRKESKDKAGDACIKIYNPDFMDEVQEYDHIILSEKGVFCIETKNYSGKITIDSNGNWSRRKAEEEEGLKNPLQQIRQHEKVLKSFLPNSCKVVSIICIANDKAIIEGCENSIIPIIKSDMLVEFIENYTSDISISEAELKKYEDTIYKYMI